MTRILSTAALLASVFCLHPASAQTEPQRPDHLVDVAVYGGTPAGLAAAITAGREGKSVLVIEPYSYIGGLMTNGLSHTDLRTFESINGFYHEVTQRAIAEYTARYGAESQQVKDCWHGTQVEPSVILAVFRKMLEEQQTIQVLLKHQLSKVDVQECCSDGSRVMNMATFVDAQGNAVLVEAKIFIDGSYEGDLMAAAEIPYAVGREARAEYNEDLAPGTADNEVQGYNFRLIVTDDPDNRIMPSEPAGYDRSDYVALLPLLKAKKLQSVWCATRGGIYKNHRPALPNNKYDVNDVSRGLVRLSLPNDSNAWPDGSSAVREAIFQKHVRHNIGMLYFLQNDPNVPAAYQKDARRFGWAADEFVNNNHLPEQLYIREARRMKGLHVYTQQDTRASSDGVRAVFHEDAIAVGDYSHNCHGTVHEGPLYGGSHAGEFYEQAAPYQIPYGVLVPKKVTNVLVPVACSSSHVGFCALRLEPIWMSLGQAAGLAAVHAIDEQVPVQYVEVGPLQEQLYKQGAATIYYGDVSPEDPDFAAAQWWGQHGAVHGLQTTGKRYAQRGKNIKSQYFEKYLGHDLQLNAAMTDELRERWIKIAEAAGVNAERLATAKTRREFVHRVWENRKSSSLSQ